MMGYTTAVPTRAWLQGDNLILNINLRTVYGTTKEELHEGFAKAFPNCISFGPLFPDSEDTFHVPDEYLTEEDILTAAKIYLANFWFFAENIE